MCEFTKANFEEFKFSFTLNFLLSPYISFSSSSSFTQALGFEDAPLMDDPLMAPYKSHYGITGRASFTSSSSKGGKVSVFFFQLKYVNKLFTHLTFCSVIYGSAVCIHFPSFDPLINYLYFKTSFIVVLLLLSLSTGIAHFN